ncbi:alpha/beta-hydrolase [Backusella circina FSU 941]|nr:alpha/beta-hydrolase [Backusella circina FSU 941]
MKVFLLNAERVLPQSVKVECNTVSKTLRKMPPSAVIKILRKVFSLPAPAARLILNDITRARKEHKPWIHKIPKNDDWSGCWIGENVSKLDADGLTQRINDADIVFFYVHGGGFRIGTCTMYMDTNIAWIKILKEKYNLNCMIMAIEYRLAPEHRYPSPVEDVVRAYEHLIQKIHVPSEKIIAIGDSAGAALILEMLFITHDPSMFEIVTDDHGEAGNDPILSELPRPAGTVLVSPIVTDQTTSASWQTNVKHDYISQYTAKVIKRDYFEPISSKSKEDGEEVNQILGIAKLQTGFTSFMPPQVLMYVGNLEVLRDDALDLACKAEADGVLWKTIAEDCVHDWFCVREVVKDKSILARADQTFADFCFNSVKSYFTTSMLNLRNDAGLEVVHEEDEEEEEEEDDDDFDSQDDQTTPSSSALFGSFDSLRLSKVQLSKKDTSSMVFV